MKLRQHILAGENKAFLYRDLLASGDTGKPNIGFKVKGLRLKKMGNFCFSIRTEVL